LKGFSDLDLKLELLVMSEVTESINGFKICQLLNEVRFTHDVKVNKLYPILRKNKYSCFESYLSLIIPLQNNFIALGLRSAS